MLFFNIYSAPQSVNVSSTEMTTTSERKMVVVYFDSSQVGNWLYISTYYMTIAVITLKIGV